MQGILRHKNGSHGLREGYVMKKAKLTWVLSGVAAGMCNGLFGGGGGAVLVPLLTRVCHLEQRKAFATSVAVMLPLCVLSAAIYLIQGELSLSGAMPYLLGGLVGGFLGGRWFCGINVLWLRRGFGLLLIYGGVRCLL